MFYHLPRAPPAFIVSPEQDSPELTMDDYFGAPNTTGSLGGDVPPRRSELYGAMSGYNNDQRSEGEASYEPSHRSLLEYEAAVQPSQGYLNFCGVGRFPVLPSPTFSVHPDAPVSLTNTSNTQKVDQNIPSGFVANSATYAQNLPIIGMTTSPTHGYYHFNPPSNRYYHSSAAAPSSYMHPRPFDATPKPPAQFSVPGNSDSFHSSPVHTGGGLHRPAIPDSEPFVTNRDGPLVDNPAPEPFFYPCFFDNCQDWISDNPKQMRDHFELHGVHLGVDPDSSIGCRWVGCTREMKKANFLRHILTHFEERWECSVCKRKYSRSDSLIKHFKDSAECLGGTPTKLVSPNAHRRQMFGDQVMLVKVLGG